MNVRRLAASILLAMLASGCGSAGTTVLVTVSAVDPISDLSTLRALATVGAQSHELSIPISTKSIPPSHSFAIDVPASLSGTLTVEVTAADSAGNVVGSGMGSTPLAAGHRADISITLTSAQNTNDMAVVDMFGADMEFVPTDMCPGPVYCQSVTQVGAGDQFTCALLSNGAAYCWGANGFGQLGLGTGNTADKHTPQRVTIVGAVSQIAVGGSHACALMASDQSVQCWGYNQSGQLGRGSKDANPHPDPQPVLGLAGTVASIAAGQYFTCAVLTTGAAQCWGANDTGNLGAGSGDVADASPQTLCAPGTTGSPCTAAAGVKEIAGGAQHACARFTNNTVACWGFNMFGELGFDFNGSTFSYPNPKTVSGIPPAGTTPVQLSLSGHNSCARMSSGQVYCWGDNSDNQLGRGTTPGDPATPAAVCSSETCSTKLNAAWIGVGGQHMCAVTAGAVTAVTCWGSNSSQQMGDGTTSSTGYDVAGNQAIAVGSVSVASGAAFSCSIIATGNLKCWGDDTSGQLGDNDTKAKPPVTPLW